MINKKLTSLLRTTGSVVFISGLVYCYKYMHFIFICNVIIIKYRADITD